MSSKLSPLQQRLYDTLAGGLDVPIKELYFKVYPGAFPLISNREMQQKLGPCIARTNAKLDGSRIEPGWARRSYRLKRGL